VVFTCRCVQVITMADDGPVWNETEPAEFVFASRT